MIVHARAYVGSPCAAHAMMAIVGALTKHELIKEPLPEADVAPQGAHRQREAQIAKDVYARWTPPTRFSTSPTSSRRTPSHRSSTT